MILEQISLAFLFVIYFTEFTKKYFNRSCIEIASEQIFSYLLLNISMINKCAGKKNKKIRYCLFFSN
jgi:hypothetical protein